MVVPSENSSCYQNIGESGRVMMAHDNGGNDGEDIVRHERIENKQVVGRIRTERIAYHKRKRSRSPGVRVWGSMRY